MTDESPPGHFSLEPEVWYHAADGPPEGPLSKDEILRLLARGSVPRSVPVWRPGMDEWRPAGEVPELAELLPPPIEGEGETMAASVAEDGEEADHRPWSRRFDLPIWGPVAGAALLVLAAAGAAWILTPGRAGIGSASGATTGSSENAGQGGPGGDALTVDQRAVARSHRTALEDSLRRLPGSDSLLATLDRQGLVWTRRVGFSGLKRLPDRPLVDHAELMGKALEKAPEELCAAVAEWRATAHQYWQFLAELPPSDMSRLLEVLRGGVMAALRDRTAWPAPDPEAVSAAFSMLGERMPESSRDSLRRVLSPEASPSPAESCWAERTLYGSVPRIPDPWRAVLARAAVTG